MHVAALTPSTLVESVLQVEELAVIPLDQYLAHWWIFPVSIGFAAIALASGVSGALFFSPFFMLVVGLSPS